MLGYNVEQFEHLGLGMFFVELLLVFALLHNSHFLVILFEVASCFPLGVFALLLGGQEFFHGWVLELGRGLAPLVSLRR